MQTSQAQQNTPSMAEMFNQLEGLFKPTIESYQKDMQAAQSITPIDPAILQQAVATGGPLSSAQDFASSNAWAMTPDMFKQTMQSRPDLGKQLSEATTLSDAIFGRTASRKAAEGMAAAKLGLGKEAASMAQRGYLDAQGNQLRREELTQRASQFDKDLAQRERQFSANLAQRKKEWADRMTEIKNYQASAGVDPAQAVNTPIADYSIYSKTRQWLAEHPLKSAKDSMGKRAWIETYMDSVAMAPANMTGTNGSFLLPEPIMYNKTKVDRVIAKVHPAGMLFYAVDVNGKPLIQEPVHFTPRQIAKPSRSAGTSTGFYNRFNPTED